MLANAFVSIHNLDHKQGNIFNIRFVKMIVPYSKPNRNLFVVQPYGQIVLRTL